MIWNVSQGASIASTEPSASMSAVLDPEVGEGDAAGEDPAIRAAAITAAAAAAARAAAIMVTARPTGIARLRRRRAVGGSGQPAYSERRYSGDAVTNHLPEFEVSPQGAGPPVAPWLRPGGEYHGGLRCCYA